MFSAGDNRVLSTRRAVASGGLRARATRDALGCRRNFVKFMAATSANFEKGREKHLNEGSGYRRKRTRVPLPAEMARWRIIARRERDRNGSTRVETLPVAYVAHLHSNPGIPFSQKSGYSLRFDSSERRGSPENHTRSYISAYTSAKRTHLPGHSCGCIGASEGCTGKARRQRGVCMRGGVMSLIKLATFPSYFGGKARDAGLWDEADDKRRVEPP